MMDNVELERFLHSLDDKLDVMNERLIRLESDAVRRNGPIDTTLRSIETRIAKLESFKSNIYAIMALFTFLVPVVVLLWHEVGGV